jgi:hypothetical protein
MLYKNILAVTLTTGYVLAAPVADNRYNDGNSNVDPYGPADPIYTAPTYTTPTVSVHPPTVPTPDCDQGCGKGTPVTPPTTTSCSTPSPHTPTPVSSCKDGCGRPENPPGADVGVFFPSAVSHYDVSTGAISCKASTGLVDKFYTNKGHDRTTLLTFTYPAQAGGRMCRFKFNLPASAVVCGSKKIDVFTSLAPAPGCRGSWPPGNQRNTHLGRLSVQPGAFAVWDWSIKAFTTTPVPCKAPNTVEAFELVGVYDEDHVSWGGLGSYGAQIEYM